MRLFDKIKKKNYLKRTELINSVNDNKIWTKSMNLIEIKELLEYLKNKIDEYKFDFDKNFIMNSRRKKLKTMIEERLSKSDRDINELVSESLFNLWEFIGDEYPGDIISDCRELGLSIKEFDVMDNEYRKKGIICIQERDIILEIIELIINYINQRDFIEDDGRKLYITKKEKKTVPVTVLETK